MMNKKIADLLNNQINQELYSAYLYLDIANFYTKKGLDGFANWYQIQAREEQDHAMLVYKYLHNNDMDVALGTIGKSEKIFVTLIDPLKFSLEHEKYGTELINEIYLEAQKVNDFRTMQFLNWFIKEQGEEEKSSSEQITKMELYGSDPRSLYMLNSELAGRVYRAPSLVL